MHKSPQDSPNSKGAILLAIAAVASTLAVIAVVKYLPSSTSSENSSLKKQVSRSSTAPKTRNAIETATNSPSDTQPIAKPAAAFAKPSDPFDTETEQKRLLAHLEQTISDFPSDAKLMHLGAVTYAEVLQTARALELFEASVKADPSDPDVFIAYADLLLQVGRAEDAITQLETARPSAVGSTPFGLALAKAYSQTARLDDALAVLQKLTPEPNYTDQVKLELARVQLQLRDFEKAEANARYVVDRGTTDRAAFLALSTALMRQGKQEEAVKYRQLMPEIEQQITPGDQAYQQSFRKFAAHTYAVLGSAFEVKGLFAKAEQDLRYSLDLAPDSEEAAVAFVSLLRKQGNLKEALLWQQRIVNASPDNILHVVNLASLAAAEQKLDIAEQALRRAVVLDDTGGAGLQLAQFLLHVGKPTEAVEIARNGVEATGSIDAHCLLIAALQSQGDRAAAARAFIAAKKLFPDAPQLVGFQP